MARKCAVLISNVLFRHESVHQTEDQEQTTEEGEKEDDGDDGRDGDGNCPIVNVTQAMHGL
jgi:hypothetical protein